MATSRRAAWHRADAAKNLSRKGIRGAGTLAAVGRTFTPRRAEGTVGNYVTRTVCPELLPLYEAMTGARPWRDMEIVAALRVFRDIHRSPETRSRALAETLMAAVECGDLVSADAAVLTERVRYLMERRHAWNAEETAAGEVGAPDFPERLEVEANAQIELAQGLRVLRDVHGIDWCEPQAIRRRA